MKTINLTFSEPVISINGIEYKVMRSDAQIVADMIDIDAKFAKKDLSETKNVLDKNHVMLEYLNKLLRVDGGNAVDKIVESVPGLAEYGLGLAGLDGILGQIVQTAGRVYAESITLKYDE